MGLFTATQHTVGRMNTEQIWWKPPDHKLLMHPLKKLVFFFNFNCHLSFSIDMLLIALCWVNHHAIRQWTILNQHNITAKIIYTITTRLKQNSIWNKEDHSRFTWNTAFMLKAAALCPAGGPLLADLQVADLKIADLGRWPRWLTRRAAEQGTEGWGVATSSFVQDSVYHRRGKETLGDGGAVRGRGNGRDAIRDRLACSRQRMICDNSHAANIKNERKKRFFLGI